MDPNTAVSNAGLPKISDIYSNISAPTTSDLGGSLGSKAETVNTGPTNAFNTYSSFMGGAGSPMNPFSTYKTLLDENGIPQLQATSNSLQKNVNDLEQAINRVPVNVSANDRNSLVTEAQREGQVNAQQYPLYLNLTPTENALGQVNTSLATQEQNIGNEVNAVGQNNQLLNNVAGMGVTVAQDNAARTMTGYTQDSENTLQGLLKKMEIQGNLDAAEWQTLSDLSEKKLEYQNNLQQIQTQHQYMELKPGDTLLNTFTGKAQPVPTP